jgi:divalent metal cation (Fe/Co/Zn/Cd) transporter
VAETIQKLDAKLWTMKALYQRVWWVNYKQSERRMTWWKLLHLSRLDLQIRFVVLLVASLIGIGTGVKMAISEMQLGMSWPWLAMSILVVIISLTILYEVMRLGFYLFITKRTIAEVEKDPAALLGMKDGLKHE